MIYPMPFLLLLAIFVVSGVVVALATSTVVPRPPRCLLEVIVSTLIFGSVLTTSYCLLRWLVGLLGLV